MHGNTASKEQLQSISRLWSLVSLLLGLLIVRLLEQMQGGRALLLTEPNLILLTRPIE